MSENGNGAAVKRFPVFRGIVLPLLSKVAVPIACSIVGALGIYYAEIAKLAEEAAREAATEEVERASEANLFVSRHLRRFLPTSYVAPVFTLTMARPAPDPTPVPEPLPEIPEGVIEDQAQDLYQLWEDERGWAANAPPRVEGDQEQDQCQDQDDRTRRYLRRALEQQQAQCQMQEER